MCIKYRNFFEYGTVCVIIIKTKKHPDTPAVRNGRVQKVEVGKSIWHMWIQEYYSRIFFFSTSNIA